LPTCISTALLLVTLKFLSLFSAIVFPYDRSRKR
jgi:hypothetical protein